MLDLAGRRCYLATPRVKPAHYWPALVGLDILFGRRVVTVASPWAA